MARGELDARLTNGERVTAAVVEAVLSDHQDEGSVRSARRSRREARGCAACGYRPTRQQPVCRSVAVAQGIRWGRPPQWHGADSDEEHGQPQECGGEQLALFDREKGCA